LIDLRVVDGEDVGLDQNVCPLREQNGRYEKTKEKNSFHVWLCVLPIYYRETKKAGTSGLSFRLHLIIS
jgi:hypothetical protein